MARTPYVVLFLADAFAGSLGARVRADVAADAMADMGDGSWNRCRSGIYFQLEDQGLDLDVALKMSTANFSDKGDQSYKSPKFDILLYSSWYELKMSDKGKWTFIHSETGVNTGLSSKNLAECVAGCPEEWLLWEAYNTTWTTYAIYGNNKTWPARQWHMQAGCNSPFRQAAEAIAAGVDILKSAPDAWRKDQEEKKKEEAYQWGDAPPDACKGGMALTQSNGTTAFMFNADYVDKGKALYRSSKEHEFRTEKNSSPGFLSSTYTYLRFSEENRWNIVIETSGLAHFDSGSVEAVVATCLSGCPTTPEKPGEQVAWLDRSYETHWQVGGKLNEIVKAQARCRHPWFGR